MQPPPAGAEAPVVVLATPLPAEDDDNAQQQRQEPDEPMSQPETENSGGYVRGVIHEMLSGTAEFAEALLYPAAKAVEEDLSALQYEAEAVTAKAEGEKAGVVTELSRLSQLVVQFQAHIQQYLLATADIIAGGATGCGGGGMQQQQQPGGAEGAAHAGGHSRE